MTGSISQSYADCTVSMGGGGSTAVGGLAGGNGGAIGESYAFGKVSTGGAADIGGLVGENAEEATTQAYSTTAVKSSYPDKGGLIGVDYSPPRSNTSTYWDTNTSKIKNSRKGAGNEKDDPGITGETTAQLQSCSPAGFDPTIWAESPSINNGFPYLINNPPQ